MGNRLIIWGGFEFLSDFSWIGFPCFPYLLSLAAPGWQYTWTLGCWFLWWVNRRIEALSAANWLESDTRSSICSIGFHLSSMVFNRSLGGILFIVSIVFIVFLGFLVFIVFSLVQCFLTDLCHLGPVIFLLWPYCRIRQDAAPDCEFRLIDGLCLTSASMNHF